MVRFWEGMRQRETGYEERIMNRDLMRGEKEKERMNKIQKKVEQLCLKLANQLSLSN